MTLTQLLMDLGVFTGSFSFTGALPLLARLIVCALITLCAMILVHGKVQGVALGYWLYLLLRFHLTPKNTVWRSLSLAHRVSQQKGKGELPSVQATWVPIDSLAHGIAGKQTLHTHGERVRYWMVFEVEGKNIRLLPESEQVRTFRRFERFLTGLEFHVQFVSWTQQVDPLTAPALLAQKKALSVLATTPRLQALQRASLAPQQRTMTTCSSTRHVVIGSASSAEALLQNPDGSFPSVLVALWRFFPFRKGPQVSRAHVLDQLRIRSSVVRKAIGQLDLRIWPLEDHEVLSCLAQCLAPGSVELSFLPELMDVSTPPPQPQKQQAGAQKQQSMPPATLPSSQDRHAKVTLREKPLVSVSSTPQESLGKGRLLTRHSQKKRLQGVHGTFCYSSPSAQARFEAGILAVADLLAPSRVDVGPDVLQIRAGAQIRYVRSFTVTGYGHHLLCGWVNTLHDLGLPLLVSSHIEPIESRFMIRKLV